MASLGKNQKSRDWLFPNVTAADDVEAQSSLLDVLDTVLNRGAVLNGDVVLGVANVDLIYVKLSALLAALDKVARHDPVFQPVAAGPRRARSRRQRSPRAARKKK